MVNDSLRELYTRFNCYGLFKNLIINAVLYNLERTIAKFFPGYPGSGKTVQEQKAKKQGLTISVADGNQIMVLIV